MIWRFWHDFVNIDPLSLVYGFNIMFEHNACQCLVMMSAKLGDGSDNDDSTTELTRT